MDRLIQSLQRSSSTLTGFESTKTVVGLICVVVGASVLAGWWLGIEALTRIEPHLVAMNPLTASCFVITGCALILHALHWRRAVIGLALTVGAFAILRIVDFWSGLAPVDTVMFSGQLLASDAVPNRMAPNTAIAFLLVSASLISSYGERRSAVQLSQGSAFGVLLISMFALIGYAFGIDGLSRIGAFIPMALHTGACLLLVAIGLLCLAPDRGLTAILRQRGSAGEMARKVLPLAITIPILVGGARLWGQDAGLYGTEAGIALQVVADVSVTFALLAASIFALHRSDGVRVEREQALAVSEQQYRLAESIAEVGHWQFDVATGVVEWSDQMKRIHGLPQSATAPSALDSLRAFHPDDQKMINELGKVALAKGQDYECSARVIRPDGEIREIRLHCTCLKDGQGRVVSLFGVVADVTELVYARRAAEDATAAKSSFLAHMSHEIRTPMNGVMGFAELLTTAALPAEQHRQATLVHELAKSLLIILNDILDIAKVDAGHFQLNEQPASLRHLIKQCVALMGAAASAKGLVLEMSIEARVPETIVVDDLRVRQVILNLLGNAVKFTDQGKVSLDVALLAGPGGPLLEIRIRDTGVGIAADRQSAIFEDFGQADSTISRRFGGTGLGLSISRRLTELMSGSLAVESLLGQGTVVTLTLPCRAAPVAVAKIAPPPKDEQRDPGGEGSSVLVVEDLLINQELIVAMLERMGHHAELAANGEEALACMQRHDDGLAQYQLVLMDVQMPVMDGLTATRAIRKRPGRSAKLPIVALTANAFRADIEACEVAGMNAHLAKPFTIGDLTELVGRWSAPAEPDPVRLAN